ATAIVERRMAERDRNFLHVLQWAVFDNTRSPYRALLDLSRCTYGDVQAIVQRDGIEAALRTLRANGVYMTFEEFKGRQPLVRHGQESPLRTTPLITHATRALSRSRPEDRREV